MGITKPSNFISYEVEKEKKIGNEKEISRGKHDCS